MHMFCTRRLPLLGRPVNMYVRNKRKLYMCNKKVGINFSPRDVVKRIVVVVLVAEEIAVLVVRVAVVWLAACMHA